MRGKRTSEGGPARGTGPNMGQDGIWTAVQFPTVFMRREAVPGASPNPMRGKMAGRKHLGRPRIVGNGYRGWAEGITGMRGTESEEREREARESVCVRERVRHASVFEHASAFE